jgi:hypothetical protein
MYQYEEGRESTGLIFAVVERWPTYALCDVDSTEVWHSDILSFNTELRILILASVTASPVGTVMGYGMNGRASIPGRCKRFFSTPQSPDRPSDPLSLLSRGYRGLFPRR